MKRAIIHNLCAASIPVMLAACSMMAPPQREQPLTAEQLAYIRTHSIVVQPLPADYDEPLRIYTRHRSGHPHPQLQLHPRKRRHPA